MMIDLRSIFFKGKSEEAKNGFVEGQVCGNDSEDKLALLPES